MPSHRQIICSITTFTLHSVLRSKKRLDKLPRLENFVAVCNWGPDEKIRAARSRALLAYNQIQGWKKIRSCKNLIYQQSASQSDAIFSLCLIRIRLGAEPGIMLDKLFSMFLALLHGCNIKGEIGFQSSNKHHGRKPY